MEILPKSLTNLAKKVITKVQESQKTTEPPKPDTNRINREIAYAKRLNGVNPKMKALDARRMKAKNRRSL